MEVKQINQLMVAMGRYGIKRVSVERDGTKVEIEREGTPFSQAQVQELFREENPLKADFERHKTLGPVRGGASQTDENAEKGDIEGKESDYSTYVTSPMVGTVYLSPAPNEPHFIKVGDQVEKNTIVCIVEAMKVMNEVKAGVSGVVQEILVDHAGPVEFATRLIRILPN